MSWEVPPQDSLKKYFLRKQNGLNLPENKMQTFLKDP